MTQTEIEKKLRDYLQKNQEQKPETVSWFDDRYYKRKIDDKVEFYPSVTTVLGIVNKPWLTRWYADLGYETAKYRSKQAAIKGSLIHEAVFRLKEGHELFAEEYPQEIWLQIYNYTLYLESLKPSHLANEMTVYSDDYKVAGTLDELVFLQGGQINIGKQKLEVIEKGVWVGDIKTGNEDNLYFKQIAAYGKMCDEMGLAKIEGTFIIYLNANTKQGWKIEYRTHEQYESDWEVFLACLKVYHDSNTDRPKILELPAAIKLA